MTTDYGDFIMTDPKPTPQKETASIPADAEDDAALPPADPNEVGGPKGPEPTRYGDWEKKGRCIDF